MPRSLPDGRYRGKRGAMKLSPITHGFLALLPYFLLGVFIGRGPYIILNWQWWAIMVSLVIAFSIRDQIRK